MKRLKFLLFYCFLSLCTYTMMAQEDDPVLFTVVDNPVHVSEFNYIYNKNNGDKADYSKESVEEYLDLYEKFKLKVQKARDMQLDTIPELINELAGYRKQLADSYLIDKEVTENLIKEVFERQKYDVKVRHIVIKVNQRATLNQQMQAKERAEEIKEQLENGADFERLARQYSQDTNTKANGGELNYLTAMLPNGYYEFENAMYELKVGEVSDVIQSNVGFHIIEVLDKRPSRGKMGAAHILLRKQNRGQNIPGVKEKIDSIYNLLQDGEDFEILARKLSQDKNTAAKGGNIGEFGISVYEKAFEDAAFGLEKDGDISKPIETSIGWHIIKRLNKVPMPDYDKARRLLQAQIKIDARYEIAKENLLEQVKEEAGIVEHKDNLDQFITSLEDEFYTYSWQVNEDISGDLLELGGKTYSMGDFAQFCKTNTRKRLRFGKNTPKELAVNELYSEFLDNKVMAFQEENLENKYPEFKALMREYEEGILLFEATKINVWDKASQDTTGLKSFYEQHKKDYVWKERADLTTFYFNPTDDKSLKKLTRAIKNNSPEEVLEKFDSEELNLTFTQGTHERGALEISGVKFKAGAVAEPREDPKNSGKMIIRTIAKIHPVKQKSLNDARGYIIADYQDYLDRQWVEKLRREYDVQVNKNVLNSLIKS